MITPSYPNQLDMVPELLKAVIRRGGEIWFSVQGTDVCEELADHFGVSRDDRDFEDPTNHAKDHLAWRNHIQQVRRKARDKAYLDMPTKDKWRVTPAGYAYLGLKPPSAF